MNYELRIRKILNYSLIALLASCFLILTSALLAHAQTPTPSNYDVTVSPVFFDLTSNPGDTVSEKVRIRNNTTSPLPIKLEVKKMTGDLNGELTLKDTSSDDSLSWIKFAETAFVAKPLEWTDVPFTITIPKEAAYGYYYAISFTQDNTSPLAKTGAKITGAAAVPILLNVRKEGAKIEGKLISFTTDAAWYEYPPIKLLTKFENTGNIHIRPTGNIFIKDMLGRQVAVLTINGTQGTILPNTKKTFESIWNDSFITREPKMIDGQVVLDKNGKPETSLKIRFDKILDLRIGKYTAAALMVVSTKTRDIPYQAETSFFVFPWKVVLGAFLFVLFAGIGFLNTFKNLIRRVFKIFKKSNNES